MTIYSETDNSSTFGRRLSIFSFLQFGSELPPWKNSSGSTEFNTNVVGLISSIGKSFCYFTSFHNYVVGGWSFWWGRLLFSFLWEKSFDDVVACRNLGCCSVVVCRRLVRFSQSVSKTSKNLNRKIHRKIRRDKKKGGNKQKKKPKTYFLTSMYIYIYDFNYIYLHAII